MTSIPLQESKRPWYVYIVQCVDSTLYTGITTDIKRRLCEHNSPQKGAKYTKARQPVELLYVEHHPCRSTASKREYQIKRYNRTKKLEIIQTFSKSTSLYL